MLITEPFQVPSRPRRPRLGAPGYRALVVPHPIWCKDEAGLRALARALVDRAIAQLTTVSTVVAGRYAR